MTGGVIICSHRLMSSSVTSFLEAGVVLRNIQFSFQGPRIYADERGSEFFLSAFIRVHPRLKNELKRWRLNLRGRHRLSSQKLHHPFFDLRRR